MEKQVKIVWKSVQIEKGIGNEFTFRVGANEPFTVNFRKSKLQQLKKIIFSQVPSDPYIELSLVTLRLDVTERNPEFVCTGSHSSRITTNRGRPSS